MGKRGFVSAPKAPSEEGRLRYPGVGKIFLFWTAIGLLTSLRYQFQRPAHADTGDFAFVAAFTACYYPWVFLTPLVFRLERRFPLGEGKWSRSFLLLLLASLPVCLAAAPLMAATYAGLLSVLQANHSPRGLGFWVRHFFPMSELLFWCSVAGGYFVRSQFQLRQQEQRTARLALEKSRLESGLKQAQLDAIRARLNPHFLFNSLQNISVMTRQDPQTASRMVARLGDLLRAVLRQDSEPESTLMEEIELTRAYAALEQMRFGEKLEVIFDIAPETQRAMVPCFLLQPLIENAVIHGLRGGADRRGLIQVTAARNGSALVLTVTDNGAGPPEDALSGKKVGVGLGSTRERLATMYPDHEFTMLKPAGGGAEVRIAIPFRIAAGEDPSLDHDHSAVADR